MAEFNLPYQNKINQNQKVIYINARIIDPKSKLDIKGQLITIGDKIANFGENIIDQNNLPKDAQIIDCQNNVLCPGLIDIQVHFRHPGQDHKEDLTTGSKSAVAGGVTCVVCQPNTSPVLDSPYLLEYLNLKSQKEAYCNIKAYAAITKNMQGEQLSDMALLKQAGAVGFTDDGLPVMNSQIMLKAMQYAANLDMVVAQHAEELNLTNKGCINEGEVSLKLGVPGIPNISESVIVGRDLEILNHTGGHYHLLHVSCAESLELIKNAKDKKLNATVEACPHHFILNDNAVLEHGPNAKMNPPLRSEQDRKAITQGLIDDVIDCITTDHAPHEIASKDKALPQAAFGIVGLETLLPLSLKLYHDNLISLNDLLAKMTYKPAQIIKFDGGIIAKNARADLTIIDLDQKWTIDPEKFHSKSKNSPFKDYPVKGRAIRTIIAGKTVYKI